MNDEKVGLIGLGTLGSFFAGHLLNAFGELVAFDLSTERVSAAVEKGIRAAGSCREVGESADVLVLSLPNPPAVEAALTGENGALEGLEPGSLIVDVSTIDPPTARKMYAAAQERDVGYLDTPVSGAAPGQAGMYGAEAGTLTFLIGGDEDDFHRARPLLEALGQDFFHLGPAGAGTTVKLISNLCSGLYQLIAAEAYTLAAAVGIGPERLLEAFKKTDANCYIMTDYVVPRLLRGEDEPGFSIELQLKDHRLAAELGRTAGVPLFFNSLASQVYQLFISQGLGGKDITASVSALANLSGVDVLSPPFDLSDGRELVHIQREAAYHA
jgi:3-hydroxyisobutyrate dehydrogenase-like beta-hydroxyacid dehydrogenase